MSQTHKPSQLNTFEPAAANNHSNVSKTNGLTSPFQLDARALSKLGADLPTIQALLGPDAALAANETNPCPSTVRSPSQADRPTADGLLNHSPEWMAAIGRIGGLSRSPAKSRAARLNGAKGGRPRKTEPLLDVVSGDNRLDVVHIVPGNPLSPPGDSRSDVN
jgi:hypothetical protein